MYGTKETYGTDHSAMFSTQVNNTLYGIFSTQVNNTLYGTQYNV
jgi:hypothetical protein